MKNSKQLSTMAFLSMLILTACGQDAANIAPATPAAVSTENATPTVPETMTPATPDAMVPATTTTMEATPSTGATTTTDTAATTVTTAPAMTTGTAATTPTTTTTKTVTTPAKTEPTPVVKPESAVVDAETLSYRSPAGTETIDVSITVEGGKITKASATPHATNSISLGKQTAFSSGISASLVGKTLNGLKVDTISGASLTTGALNAFLAKN